MNVSKNTLTFMNYLIELTCEMKIIFIKLF